MVNIIETYGTNMDREQIESIVFDELRFLLRFEMAVNKLDQDEALIISLKRVMEEFQPYTITVGGGV